MLTEEDIQKIIKASQEVFPTKEDFESFKTEINKRFDKLFDVFVTKEDLEEAIKNLSTKADIDKLLTAIDAYAKKADTYFQEMVMLSRKVDRHEKWLHQIAEKLGIKLEY